jgi:hypothetical protein
MSTSRQKLSARQLPPTDDSFHLHLRRCLFQILIWKNVISGIYELPNPTGFGFEMVDNQLQPKLMTQGPAAPELLNDIVCYCHGTCHYGCLCLEREQPCTHACTCHADLDAPDGCNNYFTLVALEEDVDNAIT